VLEFIFMSMKRHLFILTSLLMLCFSLPAQTISTTWAADFDESSWVPSGVTLPTSDTLTDYVSLPFTISLDASTIDNATKSTAFNAMGAATKVYLDTNYISAVWSINYTARDIRGVYVIESYDRGWDNITCGGSKVTSLGVAEDVFWIRGRFKYKVIPD
jgi:hypothetical protein